MLIIDMAVLLNLQVEGDHGDLIDGITGLLQYRIGKNAIGKFISFQCTPVRNDGIVGEPRTCMGQERVRPGNFINFSFLSLFNFICL